MTKTEAEEAVTQVNELQQRVRKILPKKKAQPWPGHSPIECQAYNALTGLNEAERALRKIADLQN